MQQVAAAQQKAEMERLRNEMKVRSASMFVRLWFSLMTSLQADVDARLYDLVKEHRESLAQAIKQRKQELDKKLQSAQEAMRVGDDGNPNSLTYIFQAEKETEIVNLEQRYAQQGQQVLISILLDSSSNLPSRRLFLCSDPP
jgi:hypothetical protein